jgi:hypothetical protein
MQIAESVIHLARSDIAFGYLARQASLAVWRQRTVQGRGECRTVLFEKGGAGTPQ